MIRACMDGVEVRRDPTGTTVLMSRQLRRRPAPAAERDRPVVPPLLAGPDYLGRIEREPGPRLTVRGPVDLSTTESFRRDVREASRGGRPELEIDLTSVTQLASTGVQLLHELVGQQGVLLRLIAPPGCPARAVLELTGLDHLIVEPPAGV